MKKYSYLRERMKRLDITLDDAGQQISKTASGVSYKLGGRTPWTLDEMYLIMDLIDEPIEHLSDVFPRDGINELTYEEIRARHAGGGANALPQNMAIVLVPVEELPDIGRRYAAQQGLRVLK